MKKTTSPHVCRVLFIGILCVAFSGLINSATALGLGFLFSIFCTNPYPVASKKGMKQLLKIAIIGLGFGILFEEAINTNTHHFALLSMSVIFTVIGGIILASAMHIHSQLGFLITSGTAICGGSAIAAVSPVINADSKHMSVALGIVFSLNSLALVIFPPIGELLGLSQQQFGVWSAIAIHDTSSVVGAAMSYGDEALNIATTLKLSRTLWIIPMAFFAAFWFKNSTQKITIPYFIGGFIIAIAINSSGILPSAITESIVWSAKQLLVVTLFLIGTSLSITDLRKIGLKPLMFAVCIWLIISIASLLYIMAN
ncbi:MAG: putative sulfate exporter family transporter [Gammaproteobacteria bacterium]|nr:putative sulfate exporter family transporter [Gammaproteobacteria bacterium]